MRWAIAPSLAVVTSGLNVLVWRFLSRIELWPTPRSRASTRSSSSGSPARTPRAQRAVGVTYMSDASVVCVHQIDEATFSYGTLENHLHVNAWECAQNSIAIATGGDTVQAAASGTSFPYDAAAPPTELVDFAAKVPCLQASATTDAVEACLAAPAPTAVPTAAAPSPSPSPAIRRLDHVDMRHALGSGLRRRRNDLLQRLSGRRCWRRVRARCLCGDPGVEFQHDVGRRASDDFCRAGRGRRGAGGVAVPPNK